MYKESTIRYAEREERRRRIRLVRQSVLAMVFLGVSLWGIEAYLAEHRTFAWDETVTVAVVALLDGKGASPEQASYLIQHFLSRSAPPGRNLREVEEWLQSEFERVTGRRQRIFDVVTRGPVPLDVSPPSLPYAGDSFMERYSKTTEFIRYFRDIYQREDLLLGTYDVTLFVYFFNPLDAERRNFFDSLDSVASRRDRFGIVFAPLDSRQLGNTCAVVAHEWCHNLGASDKYRGNTSVFPHGFAEPALEPRYPQRKAEIMALGIPQSPGRERPVRDLSQCIVGEKTAREINWVPAGN